MKRALITGASGFVGRYLASYLHEKGFEVWASFLRDRSPFPFRVLWLRANLTSSEQTFELIRKSRPHYVFHLAGQAVPNLSWKDPEKTFQANVIASISLLEGVTRFAPEARVLLTSSTQVYGTSFLRRGQVNEGALASPVTPYGGSKLLMEMAALNFAEREGVSVVISRACNQVGAGQPPAGVFSDFCRQIVLMERGKRATVLKVGNLNVVRDFIHVRDAVRAYYLLAMRGRKGEIYNVSSDRGVRVKDGLKFLARQSRVPFKIEVDPSKFRRNDFPRMVANAAKLRKLGWKPKASVRQALRELLAEWRGKRGAGLL